MTSELQAPGRPISLDLNSSEAEIATTMARARCLVYPTLHDGYGLPVVEALTAGVPVITSDFGSVREVAEGRGGLLVDPADVEALTVALRSLLTDDDLHAALAAQAADGLVRSVDDYADQLWEALLA